MAVDRDEVLHIARLARLRLTDDEVETFGAQLSDILDYVDQLNEELASYETIKRFSLLPRDLSEDGGELTPSLKVKRKAVEKKYMEVLDGMYQGTVESM